MALLAPAFGLIAGGTSFAGGRSSPYSPYWFVSATPNVPDSFTGLNSVSADAPNDAWSVGYSDSLTGRRSLGVIQHWNGVSWRRVTPAPLPAGTRGIGLRAVAAIAPDDVWAVGTIALASGSSPVIEHWDGTAFGMVPNPGPSGGQLWAVSALNDHDVWAAGSAFGSTGGAVNLLEHWNGTKWKIFPGPAGAEPGGLDALAIFGHDDVWVAGHIHQGYDARTMTAHWDGSTWTLVPTPDTTYVSTFAGIDGAAPDDIWAVGSTYRKKYGYPMSLVEHWDGTTWTVVPTPKVGSIQQLAGVAVSASDNVWTVGVANSAAGDNLTEHWDGTAWTVYNAPEIEMANNSLVSVAADPAGNFWAVGQWVTFDPEHVNTLALHNMPD